MFDIGLAYEPCMPPVKLSHPFGWLTAWEIAEQNGQTFYKLKAYPLAGDVVVAHLHGESLEGAQDVFDLMIHADG